MSIVHYGSGGGTQTADTGAYCSANLWKKCPTSEELKTGPRGGWEIYDHFMEGAFTVPTTEGNWGALWKGFTSSGGLLSEGNEVGGSVVIGDATDNEGASIATRQLPFKIIRGGGEFWFEARLKVSALTDSGSAMFVGLEEQQTLAVGVPMAGAPQVMIDANYVGFFKPEGDGTYFDTEYKANGVTAVNPSTNAVTMVADTYMKFGMHYNPYNFEFSWWYNGIKIATTYTVIAAAGTAFPNDVQMGLVFAVVNGTTAVNMELDFVRAVQLAAI